MDFSDTFAFVRVVSTGRSSVVDELGGKAAPVQHSRTDS